MANLELRVKCSGVNNYFDIKNKYCIYALSNKVECDYLQNNKNKICEYKEKEILPLILLNYTGYSKIK